jgi:hypothetical protein
MPIKIHVSSSLRNIFDETSVSTVPISNRLHVRPPEDLQIATLFRFQQFVHGNVYGSARVGDRGQRKHRKHLLQHNYCVIYMHKLSSLNAFDKGLITVSYKQHKEGRRPTFDNFLCHLRRICWNATHFKTLSPETG